MEFDFSVLEKTEKTALVRIKITALRLIQEGKTQTEVGMILKKRQGTISVWIKRFEAEGIECFLSNINLVQADVSAGVKVKINEKDAGRAYKIIEEVKDEYGKEK